MTGWIAVPFAKLDVDHNVLRPLARIAIVRACMRQEDAMPTGHTLVPARPLTGKCPQRAIDWHSGVTGAGRVTPKGVRS